MPLQACAGKWKYCESGLHRVRHAEARDSYCSEPYIGEYFKKLGNNVLFVVPTNLLGQQCHWESTTAKKFSINMEENEKLLVDDHARFDVIVFDEIYCNDFLAYIAE